MFSALIIDRFNRLNRFRIHFLLVLFELDESYFGCQRKENRRREATGEINRRGKTSTQFTEVTKPKHYTVKKFFIILKNGFLLGGL